MISAVVFDFDGVLADSEGLHLRAYQEVLAPLGVTLTRVEYYDRYLGFDDEGVFTELFKALERGLEVDRKTALIDEKGRVFEALTREADVLYPAAAGCIGRLGKVFPLGIASGALKHEIEAILRRSQVDSAFRFIVASGDTPQSKPAPDPYRRAAALHGRPPAECLAIEDSHAGIESAKAAGLTCIAITHTYPAHELRSADLVVDSLDEITVELIRSFRKTRP